MITNPFLDSYVAQEAQFYGLSEYKNGEIEIITKEPSGRLDDYLNVNFVVDHPPIPVLYVNGKLWMSLTRAEIQGQWVAIQMAKGKVGIGGLGLGYVVLRIAAKQNVRSVDVYEINPLIVEFFKKNFCHRDGFSKINFIVGDIREKLIGGKYDFFFNDIYQTLLPDEVIDDLVLFRATNKIREYRFWGLELVKEIFKQGCGLPRLCLNDVEKKFFNYWRTTPLGDGKSTLSCMRLVSDDLDFAGRAVAAMIENKENYCG